MEDLDKSHISSLTCNSKDDQANFNLVSEGSANCLFPNNIFYNPVQEFNRDLTVAVISVLSIGLSTKETQNQNKNTLCKDAYCATRYKLKILEGLAATGLRSVRFALEVPNVTHIVANDFDKNAVEVIQMNIERNDVAKVLSSSYSDAAMLMYQHRGYNDRFTVIDLDPYGSPSQFLDSAVQAISDGGMLCVTCTDTAVLCGNGSETCYSKYGSISLRAKFCHEMALRILLQAIESHANRYSRFIVPMLSVSVDFYVRVFVKIFTGQGKVKRSLSKLSMVHHCVGCGLYHLQPLGSCSTSSTGQCKYGLPTVPDIPRKCRNCGSSFHMGGPIWSQPIHDKSFVKSVVDHVSENANKFNTSSRILGMLSLVMEELDDVPLYYLTSDMCNVVHCVMPTLIQMRSAILNAGYQISLSHAAAGSLKTNATNTFLWDVIRTWIKQHPVRESRLTPGSLTKNILDIPVTHDIDFTEHANANPDSRKNKLVRYQPNPQPEWGPRPRAKRSNSLDIIQQTKLKRISHQGKRSKKSSDESNDSMNIQLKDKEVSENNEAS